MIRDVVSLKQSDLAAEANRNSDRAVPLNGALESLDVPEGCLGVFGKGRPSGSVALYRVRSKNSSDLSSSTTSTLNPPAAVVIDNCVSPCLECANSQVYAVGAVTPDFKRAAKWDEKNS